MKFSAWILLAFGCGGLAVLGWEPWALWPIALSCYALLFWILLTMHSATSAAAIGLAFGVGLHGFGHGWIFVALHDKVGLSFLGSCFSTLILILYNAAFTVLPCGIFLRLPLQRQTQTQSSSTLDRFILATSFASLLALGEYARSLFFNGFTSLSLGFSLIDTWFAGFAPVGGVYVVSWVGFLVASLVVVLIERRRHRGMVLALMGALIGAGWYLCGVNWVKPVGSPLSFRLLQANVSQDKKFDPQYRLQHSEHLAQLIELNTADIVVTPETAFPLFMHQLPVGMLARLQALSQRSGSHLMVGIATIKADSAGYNTVLHISPGEQSAGAASSTGLSQYRKVHLLPFGEYSPLGFGWFTRSLHIQLKDLEAGPVDQSPFVVGAQRLGTLICNEDFVAAYARRWVQDGPGATILMNPSNFAWFEGTLAIEQHIQITRMRALEVGRPILRVANTGVTAYIDVFGKIKARLPLGEEGVLSGQVQGFSGMTFYGAQGDGLLLALVLPIFLAIFYRRSPSPNFLPQ